MFNFFKHDNVIRNYFLIINKNLCAKNTSQDMKKNT